jgi:adenylate kinase
VFILLLGAPGSGKGTQGKLIAERAGIPRIATGDIIRAAMKENSPLGRQVKKFYDQGQLVPDTIILDLIKAELEKPAAHGGAVFDGFPRTAKQAELVDQVLGARGERLSHVLLLDVPEEELVRRILERARVEGRADDTQAAVQTRLQVYQQETAPLVAYYAPRGNVHRVPGTGTVEQIAQEIKRILGR